MLIDLHAYSSRSGGQPLADLIKRARALGLDGVLVADRGYSADTARALQAGQPEDVRVFVGVEVETRSGDVLLIVPEIDPFFTREEWRQLGVLERPSLEDVTQLAEREGGVVLLTQPYDRARPASPGDRMFVLEGLSGVELANDATEPGSAQTAHEAIAAGTLPSFAGSAVRGRPRQESVWATLFAKPVTTQTELVDAIRSGEFWAVEIMAQGARPPVRAPRGPRPDGAGRPPRGDRPSRDGGRSGGGRSGGGRGRGPR